MEYLCDKILKTNIMLKPFSDVPITYFPNWISDPDKLFEELKALDWVRIGNTPRSEYYVNVHNVPYTYGREPYSRTYHPQELTPAIQTLMLNLTLLNNENMDVCFLNRYHDGKDQLGWHADDSPEMDDERNIAIVSVGAEREIWFCPKDDRSQVSKLRLEHGSLCLMAPGMQDTHLHRIPKAGDLRGEGERISLTFRGYVHGIA